MGEKETMKDLEKLNSELNKLETKYMNDIAKLEENSRKEDANIESLFAQAKMLGKNISKPERDVYYWKDTRSSAEVLEEKVYENSAKGELLQQIDETRDPSKRKELIEKLNNINDEQLKEEKKEDNRRNLESKKEETREKFVNQYQKSIEEKIKENRSKISKIKTECKKLVEEKNNYIGIKKNIKGFVTENLDNNEVYKAAKIQINNNSIRIHEYIKEALKMQKEINACRDIKKELDKKYFKQELMKENMQDEIQENLPKDKEVEEVEKEEIKKNDEESTIEMIEENVMQEVNDFSNEDYKVDLTNELLAEEADEILMQKAADKRIQEIKEKAGIQKESKDNEKPIIASTKKIRKNSIAKIAHKIYSTIKQKISSLGSAIKNMGTKLIRGKKTDKSSTLDEMNANFKEERKPIVEHIDVDEKKAMEEADMKDVENVKDTEKSQEM